MSGNTRDLIGHIIHPRPDGLRNPAPITPMRVDAPLPDLIGRIMAPPASGPIGPAVPGLVAEVLAPPSAAPRPPAA